jgi:hypothetical protein
LLHALLIQATAALSDMADSTGTMSNDLRCGSINPIYKGAVEDALCSSGIRNLVLANVGFALVGVFLTVVAIAFILLSRRKGRHSAATRHNSKSPLDSEYGDADDSPTVTAPIETVIAYPVPPSHHSAGTPATATATAHYSKYDQYSHSR